MTAILKVDEIQDTSGNLIIKEDSNTITIGASGDTITIPSGATITNNGTATGFGGFLGDGQTWQNVKSSRAINTYYTNSTGKPIQIFVIADAGSSEDIQFYYTPNGGSELAGAGLYTNASGGRQSMTFTIPDGDQYKVVGNGSPTIRIWWELR